MENEDSSKYQAVIEMSVDLYFRNRDPFAAPGFLAGVTYSLSDKFALFDEAGLSLFLYDEGRDFLFSMSNTGVGMKVAL